MRPPGLQPRQFQAARRLQHDHGRVQGLEPGDQFPDSRLVIGDGPPLASGADRDVHMGLGHINAYVDFFLFHTYLLCSILALPCTMRAQSARATVRALPGDGAATLA